MRALTVRQPWAHAIIHLGKSPENRTQLWRHRGPLAVHAGLQVDYRACFNPHLIAASREAGNGDWASFDDRGTLQPSAPLSLPRGAIIGVVDMVDCHRAEPGCCDSPWAYPFTDGQPITHLVLANPRPVDPIPCKGRLGLWTVPDDLIGRLA